MSHEEVLGGVTSVDDEAARAPALRVSRNLSRLLVATDFSDGSGLAFNFALDLARLIRGTIEVVHVHSLPVYALPPPAEMLAPTAIPPEVFMDVERRLGELCERGRAAGITCESLVLIGEAHAEIVKRAAESAASVVVMGTHGRSGIKHALLGSVAERVVRRSTCPVLIVPTGSSASGLLPGSDPG
jgi:universal stress protein A